MNKLIKVQTLNLESVYKTVKSSFLDRLFGYPKERRQYSHSEWRPYKICHIDVDSIRTVIVEKDDFGIEQPFIQFGDGRGFVIDRTMEEFEHDLKCLDIKIINLCKT